MKVIFTSFLLSYMLLGWTQHSIEKNTLLLVHHYTFYSSLTAEIRVCAHFVFSVCLVRASTIILHWGSIFDMALQTKDGLVLMPSPCTFTRWGNPRSLLIHPFILLTGCKCHVTNWLQSLPHLGGKTFLFTSKWWTPCEELNFSRFRVPAFASNTPVQDRANKAPSRKPAPLHCLNKIRSLTRKSHCSSLKSNL